MGRQVLTYTLLVLVFGVGVPYMKGLDFLDPALLCAYACTGMIFAGPAAAQAFEKKPASTAAALGAIARAVAFGEAISIAMLGCGLMTLYATHSKMLTFPPDLSGLILPEALGLGLALAVAALGAWTAVQFSVSSARTVQRGVFMALLAAYFLRGRWLPGVTGEGSVIAFAAAGVFLGLLRRCLRQDRMRQA